MSRDVSCPACSTSFHAVGADWTPAFVIRCEGCSKCIVVPREDDPWMLKDAAQPNALRDDRVFLPNMRPACGDCGISHKTWECPTLPEERRTK